MEIKGHSSKLFLIELPCLGTCLEKSFSEIWYQTGTGLIRLRTIKVDRIDACNLSLVRFILVLKQTLALNNYIPVNTFKWHGIILNSTTT